ncbi:SGT1-domain-containing protein [Rickenella mellea]|uniref:SGT1-domain-containing protein n=1 Tax=Rickenella mellea TaxID=50990 RepID=A0A4Y7QMZ8_9AGAM|nr:SGT1-domain-containing protein [Rickenella mellea]
MSANIFNRTPSIAEDTLQYTLYPLSGLSEQTSPSALAALILEFVDTLLPNFIWHRDTFELKVLSESPPEQCKWTLGGHMRVGDSVDDEWCAVWLLKEISARWDFAVSVIDSDGEFLLIEAADHLPSWVTPSNAENRVWIYRSNIHLIPISYTSPSSRRRERRILPGSAQNDDEDEMDFAGDSEDGFLSVEDALPILTGPDTDTRAPKSVEDAVWAKISGYPSYARQHIHTTKAYIPIEIAKALSQDVTLVQKATEAFYTRDAIQLRAAQRMSRFPPSNLVLTTVKLTRPGYAQLVGQKFHPPKIFGEFKERTGTPAWRWRDTGMKIACGFEMLYQESKGHAESVINASEATNADARKDALQRSPEYSKYINDLSRSGYFKGEVQGSKIWKELEEKAMSTYVDIRKKDDSTRASFALSVNKAISRTARMSYESPGDDEDSDDWLNVDPETFESRAGDHSHEAMVIDHEGDPIAEAQAKNLSSLAEKVNKFVEGEGSMEGALFDDDVLSDDGSMSESSDVEDNDDNGNGNVSRQQAMNKLVAGLDPSEYGKMPPSFYQTSQKTTRAGMEEAAVHNDSHTTSNSTSVGTQVRRPIRKPILPRDNFDGVDSDDETDEENDNGGDSESEEDKPVVVGDIEIDMSEEAEEFLEFSRQTLGISDEQWKDIVNERKGRGAFLPQSAYSTGSFVESKTTATATLSEPDALHGYPLQNTHLDSFEAVMQAMDEELSRARSEKEGKRTSKVDKGKAPEKKDAEDVNESYDMKSAMDSELRATLERDDGDLVEEEPMDYTMIKNFLESFKSQSGLSGPVSNLVGRLEPGWKLPRDDS